MVYAHFKEENRIVFIELYHKNNKDNEDQKRIIDNFNNDESTIKTKKVPTKKTPRINLGAFAVILNQYNFFKKYNLNFNISRLKYIVT